MDYDDGVYEPVTPETLTNWHREKIEFDDTLDQREEKSKKSRERARKVAKEMFEGSGSELGGPHVLETMRGLGVRVF